MKTLKTILAIWIIPAFIFTISCSNEKKANTEQSTRDTSSDSIPKADDPISSATFDINSLPVSDTDLGTFPFFSFPESLVELNTAVQKKFDRLYFPINGAMTPFEGRVWKSYVTTKSGNYDDWSLIFFEKSYDEAIKAVGGVKVFDGEISTDEYERYHKLATYLGEEGSIGYADENIKVYAIHRADGGDVFIQLSGNNSSGAINILQKEPFQQTITMLKSDQIQKDLIEKGKAVLYINFDTDKATLKPDGKEAINEITKALNTEETLQIAINGYTDNTGDVSHNLQLSKDRAAAVLEALTASGVSKTRLSSEGFGAQNPIADNSTEDGKAQNRRVELIKR